MAIERVVRQGWLSRLKSSVAGILFGLLFVGVAAVVQFWNEGRTLRQQNLLDAGRAEVVTVQAAANVESAGERLVHVVDQLAAEGERLDPVFNQVAEGLALRRRVEMYQWKERKESHEETSVGGSKTTRTVYHYDRAWEDEPIDHRRFEEPKGHENPGEFPFDNEVWRAERVALGELQLSPEVVEEVGGWKPMAVASDRLPDNLAASFSADGEWLSTQSGSPRVGDVRVRFERVPEGELSVVARLHGGTLMADVRELGTLLLVERGRHSAAELFDAAERRNAGLGWALRIGGFVVMWIGFGMLFAPLAVVADVLPIAGRMTRMATTLVSGVLAALISFVAIASGWLFNRPWLLVLAVLAIAAVVVGLLRKGRARQQVQSAPPPPPPPAFN